MAREESSLSKSINVLRGVNARGNNSGCSQNSGSNTKRLSAPSKSRLVPGAKDIYAANSTTIHSYASSLGVGPRPMKNTKRAATLRRAGRNLGNGMQW